MCRIGRTILQNRPKNLFPCRYICMAAHALKQDGRPIRLGWKSSPISRPLSVRTWIQVLKRLVAMPGSRSRAAVSGVGAWIQSKNTKEARRGNPGRGI